MTKNFFSAYKKNRAWLIASAIFFILDRLLKYSALIASGPTTILGDFFSFNLVRNYNIAFSLPVSGAFLNLSISLIISGLIFYFFKAKGGESKALFLIILGAISNLFDRLYYGYVIDYLDLEWFTIFNIADILIFIGTIILAFQIFKKSHD